MCVSDLKVVRTHVYILKKGRRITSYCLFKSDLLLLW